MLWDSTVIIAALGDTSVRVLVILLITATAARLMSRWPARVKHVVWTTAMVGALLVPGISAIAPDWHVNLLPAVAPAPQAETPLLLDDSAPASARRSQLQRRSNATSAFHGAASEPSLLQRIDWRSGLLSLWAAGGLLLFLSLARGLWRAKCLQKHATSLDDDGWPSLLAACSERLGVRRTTTLVESAETAAPVTWGTLRPIIALPPSARHWPADRRRVVLLHELAHIKRNDWIVHLVSRLACIVYWFNPLIWMSADRMIIEREKACDDDVIAAGTKPSDYAAHLLDIARSITSSSTIPAATLTMARPNQLEGRLVSIFNHQRSSRGRVWFPALLLTPVIVLAASLQPWRQTPVTAVFAATQNTQPSTARSRSDRDHARYSLSRDDVHFDGHVDELDMRVRVEGQVRFSDDGTAIREMDRDGLISIEVREEGRDFQLHITHDGTALDYDWRVDGHRAEFDANARAWMETAIPIVHDQLQVAMLRGEQHSLLGEINSILGERTALQGEVSMIDGERNSANGRYHALEAQKQELRREQRSIDRRVRREGDGASKHDKEMHAFLAEKIAELENAQAELEKDLDDGLYDSRVREIRDRIEAMNLDERVREITSRIDDDVINRQVEAIEKQMQSLMVDDRTNALERQIETLGADENIERIERELDRKYDAFRKQLRSMPR